MYDLDYLEGLVWLGSYLKQATGRKLLGYSYTHASPEEFELWRLLLAGAGLQVRYSRLEAEHPSVMISPFKKLEQLRKAHPALRFAKCRAQLDDITQCVDCRLCWERPELVILFEPHGPGRRSLLERLEQTI